jgi:hypothetical protein
MYDLVCIEISVQMKEWIFAVRIEFKKTVYARIRNPKVHSVSQNSTSKRLPCAQKRREKPSTEI